MSDTFIENLFAKPENSVQPITTTQVVETKETLATKETSVAKKNQADLFSEEADWSTVFKRVRTQHSVTDWQRALVLLLQRHLDTEEYTAISVRELSARLDVGKEKIYMTLQMLTEKGFIVKDQRRGAIYRLGTLPNQN